MALVATVSAASVLLGGQGTTRADAPTGTGGDPIYMEFGGIEGDVRAAGHEKWIELTSISWGIGRGPGVNPGCRPGAAERCTASDFILTKVMDSASPKLANECCQDTPRSVVIDFCKTKVCKEKFMTITMKNTLITSYQIGGGSGLPTESLSINFQEISIEYFQQDKGGSVSTGQARYVCNLWPECTKG